MADRLAEAAYHAIAPDLLSGAESNGGGTNIFNGEEVRKAVISLPPEQLTADLTVTTGYVAKLPACNGKIAAAGFCWGGG